MTRAAAVRVRSARADDVPALVGLWLELREQGPRRGRTTSPDAAADAGARYHAALGDHGCRLVVATVGDDVVGMALLARSTSNTVMELPAVDMSHVCVSGRYRRRGVGKALVAAAATYAEEIGVEQVVVSVFPHHREANRFYARLGFAPHVIRRVAPVSLVHRRLSPTEGRAALDTESRAAMLRREIRMPRRVPRRRSAAIRPPVVTVDEADR